MSKTFFAPFGTAIESKFVQSIFGQGADGGHKHDGKDEDGHCAKITSEEIDEVLTTRLAFLGELKMYGGTNVPTGYLRCDGAAVPPGAEYDEFREWIDVNAQHLAENGYHTPDMRGRVAVGAGSAPVDLGEGGNPTNRNFEIGEIDGCAKHQLEVNELAPHTHTYTLHQAEREVSSGGTRRYVADHFGASTSKTPDRVSAIPHNNMQPYFVLNYIIRAIR